jgi:hypothetical protein
MSFLNELKRRNTILYYYGWLYFIGGVVSLIMTQTSDTVVLGINAWIKPMKFFFSIWIFCWTMGWYMVYLSKKRAVRIYNWVVVIVMLIEIVIITWQAANGRLSHFNLDPFYSTLFVIMGIAISTLMAWTAVIGYYFFKQKLYTVPMPYIWGIRFGILISVIFAFEGGIMGSMLSHTVGSTMGGAGLPIVNWSTEHGDLRVAHFIGLHALQIIPLFGYYVAKSNRSVKIFAAVYFLVTSFLLIQAFRGLPLLG